MSDSNVYSARAVFNGMKGTLHRYIEAQYHIWDEGLIEGRNRLLETEGVTFQEPRIEATPFYAPGGVYAQLHIPAPARAVLELAAGQTSTGIPELPYRHQAESLEAFLGREQEIIVATGTGSGKTECFLMPMIGSLAVESAERPESWVMPGCRALLLYPMNALVNDQLSRLRRLLGQPDVASHLRGARSGHATFGMYTGRTPYAGVATPSRDRDRLRTLVQRAYLDLPPEARQLLDREGKWPRKDLDRFVTSNFVTDPGDSEMLSRGEMQLHCPDVLVTNYSMLEYMLLRPIERSIFEQTAAWLASDKSNYFTVVLDEAHMYRGSGGAEVAYLLRRLHARLSVPRSRVRYILTSASLGKSAEALERMKAFAADLSGLVATGREFVLIRGEQVVKTGERPATESEAAALAGLDISALHDTVANPEQAAGAFRELLKAIGVPPPQFALDENGLRHAAFAWLQSFGPAALTANLVAAHPKQLRALAPLVFPGSDMAPAALEAMLALLSFARDAETGRIYAPVRSHLFFRGLAGIYACTNSACTQRDATGPSILGKMYSAPTLRCRCGDRVYELLTHRDCGAAFIRGYVGDQYGSFLWHQPSSGLWGPGGLVEAHFLVEVNRRATGHGQMEGVAVWLHKATGRIVETEPSIADLDRYLRLLRPNGLVRVSGQEVLSFNRECPVCTRRWRPGSTKIMDLATKGEAPFAQLIRTQVELQPPTRERSDKTPNAGRKSLLFSDGRQKAARLARDIPREIENDVFRQLLLLAASQLREIGREATLGMPLYVAMLRVLAKTSLCLFDGVDREQLQRDVADHRRHYADDLRGALEEPPSRVPARFSSLLLRHLGSPFYSISALTLAHLRPATRARRLIVESLPGVNEEKLRRVWIAWIQSFASEFAVDPDLPPGVRSQAAGYPVVGGLDRNGGFSARQQAFLRNQLPDLDRVLAGLTDAMCQARPGGTPGFFLVPKYVALDLATDEVDWYQCGQCATVSPVEWWGHCPICLASALTTVHPGATEYLRARKAFFRDPVNEVLRGSSTPFNLSVEEHTAQLSYRDVDDASTTIEDFERRFRDILVSPSDTSIDVLSSTTTMEVGIDIGSLVAVGLRNVPPLRQNYQQRAGRAGRRGSAVSTVVTYAQNSPHDSHYFEDPEPIIAGEPTLPGVDTENPRIIERHIRAQLIQSYFHDQPQGGASGDIFSVLGETMSFYSGSGPFSLVSFTGWLAGPDAQVSFSAIRHWLPSSYTKPPEDVASQFVQALGAMRPASAEELDPADEKLIEFLFSRGFLPAYAFPRDLCVLQIETVERTGNFNRPKIVQRPQQGMNVALSEYAPGRFVVVDKQTYRVGTVSANGSTAILDRADRLFADRRYYVHCPACEFSPGFRPNTPVDEQCPLCRSSDFSAATVIEPEVMFPEGGREVDEFDDDQVFTNATSAQLSLAAGTEALQFRILGSRSHIAFARDQQLVMVNKGQADEGRYGGFLLCNRCGKWASDAQQIGPHSRDYLVSARSPGRCTGQFEPVYLGYGFASDVLIVRAPLMQPLRFDPVLATERMPIANSLQSLAEAFVLGISQELDIDIREISAGYRFIRQAEEHHADLFVYDTLAGGAGYATEAGNVFAAVMSRAEALLSQCTCSASCDKCLRHYANRFHHSTLDRTLALSLLRFVRDGVLPPDPSLDEQRSVLEPLRGMLQLAGWTAVQGADSVPYSLARDGRVVELFSYPSLVSPSHYGYVQQADRFAFSPFELSWDLPGAFGVVT